MQNDLCVVHDKKLVEMHEAIYGNGHPENGLVWIAKENRRMIHDLQDFTNAFKKWSLGMFTFLVCSGLAALGSFAIQLYKMMVLQG